MTATCGDVDHSITYSRHQLIDLRHVPASKSKSYVNVLAEHDLLRYHERRGGALARGRLARASVYQHNPGFPQQRSQQVYQPLPT